MHTFADPIARAELVARDKTALISGEFRFTYGELASRCRRVAGALGRDGIAPGEWVAVLAANSAQYIELYLAIPASGRVVVPLNTRHAEPELVYALEDSGARVLVTDRKPSALDDVVERVIRLPGEYESFVAEAPEAALGVAVHEDSLAGLFYTGGTTGVSKGVMLSHRNLIANTYHWIAISHPRPDDRYLVMAPLFHAAGSNSVLATIWFGGLQIAVPTFDPAAVLDLIEAERITATLGVPTMIAALAEEQLASPRNTETLRVLAHGGSPVATEVLRRAHRAFPSAELIHLYGATETAPLATALTREQEVLEGPRGRSCGQPIPGVDVRVFDTAGHEVAVGELPT